MESIEIINLTPHPLVIMSDDGTVIKTIPSSGIARVIETSEPVYNDGIVPFPVFKKTFENGVEGLPDEKNGTLYYVSSIVANHTYFKNFRNDLLIPGEYIRDGNGQIIGVKSFSFLRVPDAFLNECVGVECIFCKRGRQGLHRSCTFADKCPTLRSDISRIDGHDPFSKTS